jgi:hypothetical protein
VRLREERGPWTDPVEFDSKNSIEWQISKSLNDFGIAEGDQHPESNLTGILTIQASQKAYIKGKMVSVEIERIPPLGCQTLHSAKG